MARRIDRRTAFWVIYANIAVLTLLMALGWARMIRRIHRYDALIHETAGRYGADPRLISAVVWKESRFREDAVGEAGEIGLMQVTENAAIEWARAEGRGGFRKEQLFDPRTNLRAGTWYLARALTYWEDRRDPVPYALAEYNAGRSNAIRWASGAKDDEAFVEAITYPSTRRYVDDIRRRYRRGR